MASMLDGLPKWQRLNYEEAVRQIPARIATVLADPGHRVEPAQVPKLVTLLSSALLVADNLDTEQLSDLIDLAFDTVLIVGAGSSYRDYEGFLSDALELIEILDERGAPTSRHYLSAARFQAGLANGDPVRRGFIERAVTAAQSPYERVIAQLTLARFCVDVSDYLGARDQLASCQQAIAENGLSELRANLESSAGLSYYYTDPATARRHFEESVRLGRENPENLEARQPAATSLHFLGRLAADRGEYRKAIKLYAEGERLSDDYLTGHGYYHQRIAEILIDHGSADEARYHLIQAEQTFTQVGQRSSGYQVLQASWARWHLRQNDHDRAEVTLLKALEAARKEATPRVELILIAELLRLHLRQRTISGIARLMSRAVALYLTGESIPGRGQRLRQAITVADMAIRFLRPRKRAVVNAGEPLLCPCGSDHGIPSDGTYETS